VSSKNSKKRILNAALSLISKRGGANVTMAEIATAAGVSRQAVYLHFADRGELFVGLARYVDEKRGLAQEIQKIADAPSGVAALSEMAALQARTNYGVWAIARAFDAVRRTDEAVEQSWQDRLEDRLKGCREIVSRLQKEGTLRPGLDPTAAADLLWTITSLRTWEDLVLQRGWSAKEYEQHVSELLLASLTARTSRGQVNRGGRTSQTR
jgi:AcrR family transcriptional regulator